MGKWFLVSGWSLKVANARADRLEVLADETGWIPADVPGLAHDTLWRAGRLPNPYVSSSAPRLASSFLQDVWYRCRFQLPSDKSERGPFRLVFEGLDTEATVWLNGEKLLHSDNMFCSHTVQVESLLKPGEDAEQELVIRFASALRTAQERLATFGPRVVWNGDAGRVYVRKAQYAFGWDFGPALVSCGPWRPIFLSDSRVHLTNFRADMLLADDLESATLRLHPTVSGDLLDTDVLDVSIRVHDPQGRELYAQTDTLPGSGGQLWRELPMEKPALWWPAGHGPQSLYQVALSVSHNAQTLCQKTLRLGARKVELVTDFAQHTDGESFYFVVNNRPVFCGGANWIPPELVLPSVSRKQVSHLLDEALFMGMCMVRVWGGGIYETDDFYDLCDEKGLLVWQDFAFACGLYPGHKWFLNSVAQEAEQAVKRLRHHPSLVLFAGNNEDYSIAQSLGLYDGPRTPLPSPPEPDQPMRFDGRAIYEDTLAQVVAEHAPHVPYWPGSPYGRQSADPNDRLDGDRHIWDVWHGAQQDYQAYGTLCGRFVSEFGMQGVPSLHTITTGLGFAPDGISILAGLNKGQDGPERIETYLSRNLPSANDLPRYIYASQLLQAEALSHGFAAFRRQFGQAETRGTGGALVWQLDDCWPGVSWSVLEHHSAQDAATGIPVRRKAACYAIKRVLAPWAVGLAHNEPSPQSGSGSAQIEVWACHSGPANKLRTLSLRLSGFSAHGEQRFSKTIPVEIIQNATTELGVYDVLNPNLIVRAELLDTDSVLVARCVLWPQPLRNVPLEEPEVLLEEFPGDDETTRLIRISVARPTKGLWLSASEHAVFSDNLLDLLPDETVEILVRDPMQTPIRLLSLGTLQKR